MGTHEGESRGVGKGMKDLIQGPVSSKAFPRDGIAGLIQAQPKVSRPKTMYVHIYICICIHMYTRAYPYTHIMEQS